jgi:hypothetical protein
MEKFICYEGELATARAAASAGTHNGLEDYLHLSHFCYSKQIDCVTILVYITCALLDIVYISYF